MAWIIVGVTIAIGSRYLFPRRGANPVTTVEAASSPSHDGRSGQPVVRAPARLPDQVHHRDMTGPVEGEPLSARMHDRNLSDESRNDSATEAGSAAWIADDLRRMLSDTTESERWRNYCVQHLANHFIEHGDPASLDAVMGAIGDPEAEVRDIAVFSLGRIIRERSLSAGDARYAVMGTLLVAKAAPANDANTRVAAIRACGMARMVSIAGTLVDYALDNKESQQVRLASLDVLADIGTSDQTRSVGPLLTDASSLIAAAAHRALHESSVPRPGPGEK